MGGVDSGGQNCQRNSDHSDKTEGSLGRTEVHLPWLSERSPVGEMVQSSGEGELQCIFEQDSGDFVEKGMAPHSSTLAWKIPWMEEPGRLQSMGSQRVRHD